MYSGNDLMLTWCIILLGRSWSKLDRLLGSWLSPWYWPRNLSPAAILRNFFKSTTYKALENERNKYVKTKDSDKITVFWLNSNKTI
jgi:hypothetical protein